MHFYEVMEVNKNSYILNLRENTRPTVDLF